MFEGLSEDQKQQVAADLSEMDAKLPGGGLTLGRVAGLMAVKASDGTVICERPSIRDA